VACGATEDEYLIPIKPPERISCTVLQQGTPSLHRATPRVHGNENRVRRRVLSTRPVESQYRRHLVQKTIRDRSENVKSADDCWSSVGSDPWRQDAPPVMLWPTCLGDSQSHAESKNARLSGGRIRPRMYLFSGEGRAHASAPADFIRGYISSYANRIWSEPRCPLRSERSSRITAFVFLQSLPTDAARAISPSPVSRRRRVKVRSRWAISAGQTEAD
jgi:hypothetical protein